MTRDEFCFWLKGLLDSRLEDNRDADRERILIIEATLRAVMSDPKDYRTAK